MFINYKNILLSATTALLLTACGGGVTPQSVTPQEETPTVQTKLAKAQLGVLSEATVEIYELGVTPYKHLFTEKTSSGTTIEDIGNFNAHAYELDKDKFYLYKVSNGLDMDADDDGIVNAYPTINQGTFHAIVKGESAQKVKGEFRVTSASELLYKKVKADINDTNKLEENLNLSAKEVFQKDIDEDSEVTAEDILQYNPIVHKDTLTETYHDKLPQIIKDIHEDKKQEVKKQAPTAEAGRDRSIMIGGSIELRASGTDLDGRVVSYEWSDSDGVLSSEKNFIYSADVLGTHILTLTVKDNDGLEATDRVHITVVEKPNSIPSANSATYTMDEDTVKKIKLDGKDKDGNPLTYKVLVSPTYGTLSGKAPNLLYTPKANYNGKDRFIFVTNDGKADSKRAKIDITIQKSNDKPVIVNDGETLITKEDTSKTFTLKAEDVENDKLTYIIVKKPTHGKLTHKKESFIYTPDANYNGNDSFIIKANDGENDSEDETIMITVTPVNDAPTVDAGGDKSTIAQTSVTLVAKGTDIDGTISSYRWFGDAKTLGNSKSLNYTPQTVGSHTLSVTVTDNDGLKATDSVIVTATEQPNKKPIAESQSVLLKENSTKAITLKATDADEDKLTYKIITAPKHGKLTKKSPNVIYSPNKDYFGLDSFVFSANDGKDDSNYGKVSLTINEVKEVDKTAPVITLRGAATVTVVQGKRYTEAGATAKDTKDGIVKVATSGNVNIAKVGTYKIIYTAIDKAGNRATKTRTVKVVAPKDTIAPVITLKGSAIVTLYVGGTYVEKGTNSYHSKGYYLAIDNIDSYVKVIISGKVDTSKAGTYKITYTATDKAGNKATKIRTVKVIAPSYHVSTTVEGNKLIVKWSGFPNKRNAASIRLSTPGISSSGSINKSSGEDGMFRLEQAEHTIYHYVLTVTENANNKVVYTKKFDIQPLIVDKTAPVITLRGDSLVTIYLGKRYQEKGATAIDNIDGAVGVSYTDYMKIVNTSKVGTYTMTYTAVDRSGNKATKTRTIKVIRSKAPVITIEGASATTLFQGEKYRYDSVSAKDDIDGAVRVTMSGRVDTSKLGTYTLTYTAVDSEGNKATKRQTVQVLKSEYKVSASFEGRDIILDWNSFPRASCTIEVKYRITYHDGTSKVRTTTAHTLSKRIGSKSLQLYTHNVDATITVFDSSKAVISTQKIKIPSEESLSPLPKIIFDGKHGEDAINIKVGDIVHHPKPKAYSKKYGYIPVKIVEFGPVYGDQSWSTKDTFVVTSEMEKTIGRDLIVLYEATDKDGNVGKGYVTYKVAKDDTPAPVNDTRAPILTMNGEPAISVRTGRYKELGAVATDAVDGAVSVSISYGSGIAKGYLKNGKPGGTQGVYVVIYTAKDKAGNISRRFRYVYNGLALYAVNLGAVQDVVYAKYGAR